MHNRYLIEAATIIGNGGVIAYPTEAVFGLGCHPDSIEAVAEILRIKQRPVRAGLIVIADTIEALQPWIEPTDDEWRRLESPVDRPTSWLVTARAAVPGWLTGGRRQLAVRITAHPVAAALCETTGVPLVSTSANRRGHRPARTTLQARRWFGADLDLVVPGATDPQQQPSRICNAATGEVLRD